MDRRDFLQLTARAGVVMAATTFASLKAADAAGAQQVDTEVIVTVPRVTLLAMQRRGIQTSKLLTVPRHSYCYSSRGLYAADIEPVDVRGLTNVAGAEIHGRTKAPSVRLLSAERMLDMRAWRMRFRVFGGPVRVHRVKIGDKWFKGFKTEYVSV